MTIQCTPPELGMSDVLNALYSAAGDFISLEGPTEGIDVSSDEVGQFLQLHPSEYRLSPVIADSLAFFVGLQEDTTEEAWRDCALPPTVVMFDGSRSIFCYALETPVPVANPEIKRLMEFFGMEEGEAIPLPGDTWKLVRADLDTFYTVDQLNTAYFPETAPAKKYGDADIILPYREEDHEDEIVVTVGANRKSMNWIPKRMPRAAVIAKLCKHEEGVKDGPALVFADMVPGQRLKNAVKAVYALGLDIDNGTPTQRIDDALENLGCMAVRYTTYSHESTSTQFRKDEVLRHLPDIEEVDTEVMRRYCRDIEKWDESLIPTIEYVEQTHESKGIMVTIKHKKMDKNRVIVFLREPYDMAKEAKTQQEAMKNFAKLPAMLADHLQVPLDKSCVDPSRLFYTPRHKADADYSISLFGGPLFDWRTLKPHVTDASDALDKFLGKQSKSITPKGKELGKWSRKRAVGFQIVDVLRDHADDRIRGGATMGVTIECPFDSGHSNPGDTSDTACFAVNAAEGGNEIPIISCRHGSCQEYTWLDHLGKMLEDSWFGEEVLTDENYNIAVLDDEEGRPQSEDLTVIEQKIGNLNASSGSKDILPILSAIREMDLPKIDLSHLFEKINELTGRGLRAIQSDYKNLTSKAKAAPSKLDPETLKWIKKLSDSLGESYKLPPEYLGSYHIAALEDGTPWIFMEGEEFGEPLFTPVHLRGKAKYMDRGEDFVLAIDVYENGKWLPVEIDAGVLADVYGKKLLEALVRKNMLVGERGRREIVRWFSTTAATGSLTYHRPGWRDGAFICPTGKVLLTDKPVELAKKVRLKCEETGGTFEGWKAAAAKIFAIKDAYHFQFGILASSAGCLADLLGHETLQYSLDGPPGRGKSTTQELCTANFGIPTLGQGLFISGFGTKNSTETDLERASGTALCMDETKHIEAQTLHDLLFMVESGVGKRRNDINSDPREVRRWSGGAFLMSAETPLGQRFALANVPMAAGITRRVLAISYFDARVFTEEEWADVVAITGSEPTPDKEGISGCYGWFGPAFVTALRNQGYIGNRGKATKRLEEMSRILYNGTNTLVRKATDNVTYPWLAGEIAAAEGLIPKDFDAERWAKWLWKQALGSDIAPIDPAERAVRILFHNLIQRRGNDVIQFSDRAHHVGKEAKAYFGTNVKDGRAVAAYSEGDPVYVIPTVNVPGLSGEGADVRAITKHLEDTGALVRQQSAKRGRTWNGFPGLGKDGQYLVIRADAVEFVEAPPDRKRPS